MDTGRITIVLGGLGVLALMITFLPRPIVGGPDHLREGSRGGPR